MEENPNQNVTINNQLPPIQPAPNLKKIIASRQIVWDAPLPPPEILIKYNDAEAGLAKRVVDMAEMEMKHRHNMDHKTLNLAFIIKITGQIGGAAISICAIAGGVISSIYGHPAGITISLGGLLGIAGTAYYNRKIKDQEKKFQENQKKKPKKKKK